MAQSKRARGSRSWPRAPLADVHGETWTYDYAKAVGLFAAMDMMSVHWNAYLQAWVAFYSPPFDNRVMLRTSPELTGPWSRPMHAFDTLPPGDDPNAFAYSGLGHAEYARQGGRIEYVSYYRGTQPWFGEIRLVQVELQ